jgi:hypothetical protein
VGTGKVRGHHFGRIPLTGAYRLRYLAILDQGMAVVHELVAVAPRGALAEPVAGQCWVSVGLAGQQRIWIAAGTVGVVAEFDASEISFCPFLLPFRLSETFTRAWWRWRRVRSDYRSAPVRHGMPRPAAWCHPLKSAHR